MSVTRRDAIRAVVVAGMGLIPAPTFAAPGPQGGGSGTSTSDFVPMSPDLSMTRDAFASQLRQTFVIYGPNNSAISVRLVAVRDCPNAVSAGTVGSQTCFSGYFEGPGRNWLADGTYLVDTPQYGQMKLFVKLASITSKKTTYEMVVYRLDAAFAESAGLPPGI